MDKEKEYKLIIFSNSLLITLILSVLNRVPPASGYEISIYGAYPWYFWVLVITLIFISVFSLFKYFVKNDYSHKFGHIGLLFIIIINLIILFLPLIRGYLFLGNGPSADLWAHAGRVNRIFERNYVSSGNTYPIIHVFLHNIGVVTNLNLNSYINFIPILFSVSYIFFFFILSKHISSTRKQTLFFTLFAIPLIFSKFHYTMHPAFQSFVFLPLYLYIYEKLKKDKSCMIKYFIILIILSLFILYYHPITTFILILIFSSFLGYIEIIKRINPTIKNFSNDLNSTKEMHILIILSVLYIMYILTNPTGLRGVTQAITGFFFGAESTVGERYVGILRLANLSHLQILRLFFLRYGPIFIYGFLALFVLFNMIKKTMKKRKNNKFDFFILKYSLLLVIVTFFAFLMNFILGLVSDPVRNSFFPILFSSIIIGGYFSSKHLPAKNNLNVDREKIKMGSILCFVAICIVVSVFNVYSSPITWSTNSQTTEHYFSGGMWFSENRDIEKSIASDYGASIRRIEQYRFVGATEMFYERNKKAGFYLLPTRFGFYEENQSLDDFDYIINTKLTTISYRAFPEDVQDEVTQFREEDFERIDSSPRTNKIYSNGEFEVRLRYEE